LRILVTGGRGFIGKNLIEHLSKKNFKIVSYDLKPPIESVSNRVEQVVGNILDRERLLKALEGCDAVVHLAACSSVPACSRDVINCFETNVTGTAIVADCASESGVKLFIYASSASVYGSTDKPVKMREDHPYNPLSFYALSKVSSEEFLKLFSKLRGLPTVILRIANPCGKYQDKGIVYDVVRSLVKSGIFRGRGSGDQTRSYIHTSDLSEAFRIVLESRPAKMFELYNLGNIDYLSAREVADAVRQVICPWATISFVERTWEGDAEHCVLDSSKFFEEFGWRPKLNSLKAVKRAAKEICKEFTRTTGASSRRSLLSLMRRR